MLKNSRKAAVIVLACMLAGGCRQTAEQDGGTDAKPYVDISLYSDVNFWKLPEWDTAEGTITGEITKQTGVTVDAEIPMKEADTRLKLMLLDDELPDVISVIDSTTVNQLVTSGKVWKIDEFLKTYKPDSHLLTEFPEDIKQELIKRDGGWYALPSHLNSKDARDIWKPCDEYWEDVVAYSDNNAIIWNKNLLEQLGIDISGVVAQEDVFAVLERAKRSGLKLDGQSIIPLLPDGNDYRSTTLKFLLENFGAEWVDKNGDYQDNILQPEAKEALKFVNTAVRNGYIDPEHFKLESSQIYDLARSGRALCFIGNIADVAVTEEDWLSTGVVLSETGSVPVQGKNLRATAGWIQTFISKDCRHPKEIAAWVDYMTSEEGKMLCTYGFPEKDYTVGEDGKIHRTEEGRKKEAAHAQTGMTAFWMFANTAWARSKTLEGEENGRLVLAYGMYPQTVQYDSSLLMFPADLFSKDSEAGVMEQEVSAWKESQILVTVLAENEAEFEREYKMLTEGLRERGIEKADAVKNQEYRKNCREYQSYIEKINSGSEDLEHDQ